MTRKPIVYHIPVCPFSQRLEILLALKGLSDAVEFRVVDITRSRDPDLLRKTRGTTALPVLEMPEGGLLKESLVILRYVDEALGGRPVRQSDPYKHAVENMLIAREGPFTSAGYRFVMNRDAGLRESHREKLLAIYEEINGFLMDHNPDGTWLFDNFALAETVFSPLFMRFWFLDYYEDFELPRSRKFARVRKWRRACLAHPAAQQVSEEEIVKLYYDYAMGVGNGELVPGRKSSSFVFEPHWRDRPWPPRDKYGRAASDEELGLAAG